MRYSNMSCTGSILAAAGSGNVTPFAQKTKSTLRVRALAGADTAEIDLFGIVGGDWMGDGITKEDFAAQLKGLGAGVKTVKMRLSSPGGDVHDGRAIANMMKEHPAKFEVNVIAEACSIASVIAIAGDSVRMSEGAVMLIHRCYVFNIGNCVELRALADDLERIDEGFIKTYMAKTGMSHDAIVSLLAENRYMSAEEAKELGFADTIATPAATSTLKIAAFDIDRSKLHLPPLPADAQPRKAAAIAAIAAQRAALKM
jgi:ATP-dependent Clp protease protease subunit